MKETEDLHDIDHTPVMDSLNVASMGSRFGAYLIDRTLVILFYFLLFFLLIAIGYGLAQWGVNQREMTENELLGLLIVLRVLASTPLLSGILVFLYLIGYVDKLVFAAILRRSNGLSPGKRILGLRVVRLDGGVLGWGESLLREVVMKGLANEVCLFLFLPASFIYGCRQERHQTLQDVVVKTVVIKEK